MPALVIWGLAGLAGALGWTAHETRKAVEASGDATAKAVPLGALALGGAGIYALSRAGAFKLAVKAAGKALK